MKYVATTNSCVKCDTFEQSMMYFAHKFLNSNESDDSRKFLYEFGDYIEKIKLPCDKIILDPFTGYADKFTIKLIFDDKVLVWLRITVIEKFNTMYINEFNYTKNDIKDMFHSKVERYFDERNAFYFDEQINICGFNKTSNDINVVLDYYNDYEKTDREVTITGTFEDIFDKYTSMNDRLKYCNGSYYKFRDKNFDKLYSMFVCSFKGNYFLMNAVKRGCLID